MVQHVPARNHAVLLFSTTPPPQYYLDVSHQSFWYGAGKVVFCFVLCFIHGYFMNRGAYLQFQTMDSFTLLTHSQHYTLQIAEIHKCIFKHNYQKTHQLVFKTQSQPHSSFESSISQDKRYFKLQKSSKSLCPAWCIGMQARVSTFFFIFFFSQRNKDKKAKRDDSNYI